MNLIILDEEFTDTGSTLKSMGQNAQTILEEFTTLIEDMHSDQSISGTAADQVVAFVQEMKASLNDQFQEILEDQSTEMNNFITDVDSADSFLY